MSEVAVEVEHEQLACLGHLLASQLYVAQGLNGEALDEMRRLRLREQLIRSDGLETREKVVDWQVDLRQREESVHRLEITSRQLEKLSLEGPLAARLSRGGRQPAPGHVLRARQH